jgi:GTP-binding protein HflX
MENHTASVERILEELSLSQIPRLLVFNKADLLSETELANLRLMPGAVTVSALKRKSLVALVERIGEMLEGG